VLDGWLKSWVRRGVAAGAGREEDRMDEILPPFEIM